MEELVNHLTEINVLKTREIIDAFNIVDRKDFVPAEYVNEAYGDFPLPIGYGQTISQPYTVAFMLELLGAKKGDRILDVGSGSGWTTALLSQIAGETGTVTGVERIPELLKFGANNLKKYKFPHAEICDADSGIGLPEKAPFDKILVSAAGREVPEKLVSQLKNYGVLVIPINNAIWRITKLPYGKLRKEKFEGFQFVPLIYEQ